MSAPTNFSSLNLNATNEYRIIPGTNKRALDSEDISLRSSSGLPPSVRLGALIATNSTQTSISNDIQMEDINSSSSDATSTFLAQGVNSGLKIPQSRITSRSSSISSIKSNPDASRYTNRLIYPITDKIHPISIFVSQLSSPQRRELSQRFDEIVATESPDVKALSNLDITMLLLMRMNPQATSNVLSMSLLKDSQVLKQALQKGNITVSSCVIGSGPVGIAAAAANGSNSTIVVDANEVVGGSSFGGRHEKWWGQHAVPQVGFAINSTSRMPNKSTPTGGGFDFNPGPLQIAKDVISNATVPGVNSIAVRHLSGDSWPDASELARTILMNAVTIKNENGTNFLLGFKVDKVNFNPIKKVYELSAINAEGERVHFNALTLTQAAGIGRPSVPTLSLNTALPNAISSTDIALELDRTSGIIKKLNSSKPQERSEATHALSSIRFLTPQQWFDITKYSQQPSQLYQGRKPGFVGDGDSIYTVLESIYRLRGKQALHDSAGNYIIQRGCWFTRKYKSCSDVKNQIRSRYADIQTVAGRFGKDNGVFINDRLASVNFDEKQNQLICRDRTGFGSRCDFLVVGTGYEIGTKPVFEFAGSKPETDKFARDNGEPLCFTLGPQGILIGPATGPDVNKAKSKAEGTLGISENTASVFLRAKDGATAQRNLITKLAEPAAQINQDFSSKVIKAQPPKFVSGSFETIFDHLDNGITFNEETAKSALAFALPNFDITKGSQFAFSLQRLDDDRVYLNSASLNEESFGKLWHQIPEGGRNHILSSVSLVGEEAIFTIDIARPKVSKSTNEKIQTIRIDVQFPNTFSDMESLKAVNTEDIV